MNIYRREFPRGKSVYAQSMSRSRFAQKELEDWQVIEVKGKYQLQMTAGFSSEVECNVNYQP
jgi:hypothetical protein